jgi:hypothetical protein
LFFLFSQGWHKTTSGLNTAVVNPINQQKGLFYRRYTDRRYKDRRYTGKGYRYRQKIYRQKIYRQKIYRQKIYRQKIYRQTDRQTDRKDYYTEEYIQTEYIQTVRLKGFLSRNSKSSFRNHPIRKFLFQSKISLTSLK